MIYPVMICCQAQCDQPAQSREVSPALDELKSPRLPQSILKRTIRIGSQTIPAAILILMPKCPMCLVTYAALTGATISMTTAGYLRLGILATCIAALSYALVFNSHLLRKRSPG
jgi:hypothetical protein